MWFQTKPVSYHSLDHAPVRCLLRRTARDGEPNARSSFFVRKVNALRLPHHHTAVRRGKPAPPSPIFTKPLISYKSTITSDRRPGEVPTTVLRHHRRAVEVRRRRHHRKKPPPRGSFQSSDGDGITPLSDISSPKPFKGMWHRGPKPKHFPPTNTTYWHLKNSPDLPAHVDS